MLRRTCFQIFALVILCAGGGALADSGGGYDWARWRSFWSFVPVVKPVPPTVNDLRFAANPIDQFIFAKLAEKGLKPAAQADRATLIRRATFDLTGLPPTAPEIREFLADSSPDAYDKLIDRLLASPHYGERWGRHWLDVARYVPGRIIFVGIPHTSGDQAYRDYVVRAFNEDKPFNQFATEQLAGDLLPASADRQQEFDQVTAPAFLSIGPWFDECTDPNRLRMEMINEMISTTSQAFLGLSVGCARCHDHKFDPIPTADYYALAGVLGSTKTVGQLTDFWRDGRVRLLRPLAMPDELAADGKVAEAIEAAKTKRWDFLAAARTQLLDKWSPREADYRAAANSAPHPFTSTFKAENFDGEHNLRIAQLVLDGSGVNVLETMTPTDQWVKYKLEAPEDGRYLLEALYCSDEKTPLLVEVNGEAVSKDALAVSTGGWDLNFEQWREVARFDLRSGLNFLRLTAHQGTFPRLDRLRLRRCRDEDDQALQKIAGSKQLDPMILSAFVADTQTAWPTIAQMPAYLDDRQRKTLAAMDAEIDRLSTDRKPYPLVVSVADQATPADSPIHNRGDVYDVSAQTVPRGMPRLLDQALPRPEIPSNESGRRELAQWITDPRNPLTARVMVNRIWQWHFGRGIVATSSDFGSRGAPPTHPELLEWLAATFIERGWSIKQMQKLIMTSQAYRMASQSDDEQVRAVDPDDKLLSHFPRQRLEAEELYDAMLASANLVLPQPVGGPLDVEKSKNRALYVLASNRAPKGLGLDIRKMFPLFDYDMSGASIAVRPVSSTPSQSLFWLNSPVVEYYAGRFADRLLKMDRLDDARRVEMAYLIAVGHSPDSNLRDSCLSFINSQIAAGASRRDAWTAFCQALYASDEFHYLD